MATARASVNGDTIQAIRDNRNEALSIRTYLKKHHHVMGTFQKGFEN